MIQAVFRYARIMKLSLIHFMTDREVRQNTLLLTRIILSTPLYRLKKKKKYDYIVYFNGHLGDYFLCHCCFEQLRQQNKSVLLITNLRFDEKLNEIYRVFSDVMFLKSKKDWFSIPRKVCAESYFAHSENCVPEEIVISRLICANNKGRYLRYDPPPNSRLNRFDISTFQTVIPMYSTDMHMSEQIAKALSEAFNIQIEPKLPDFRWLVGPRTIKEPYFILNTSIRAATGTNKWPIDRFARLAEYCVMKTGLQSVYIGPKSAYQEGLDLIKMCSCEITNLIGQTTLSDLVTLVGNAAFVIGNDTGTTHIAASCKVDGFSISFNSVGKRFLPYPDDLYSDVTVAFVRDSRVCSECFMENPDIPGCLTSNSTSKILKCVERITVQNAIDELERSHILSNFNSCQTGCDNSKAL